MIRKNPDKTSKIGENLQVYARYSSLAFQMMAIVIAGVFGGRWIDKQTTFEFPFFTLMFSVLAVTFAIYFAIKDFLRKPKK